VRFLALLLCSLISCSTVAATSNVPNKTSASNTSKQLAHKKRIAVKARSVKPAIIRVKAATEPARIRQLALRSSSAIVIDQQTGQFIVDKNSDEQVPIASLTKLMTAMVTLDSKLPLDEPIRITNEDVDRLRGSRSRVPVGTVLTRERLLNLALMSSENRAAAALARSYPGGTAAFVVAMNHKAKQLGMTRSSFADSTGLHNANQSTARDVARLVSAAYEYQLIREYSTTSAKEVALPRYRSPVEFHNTNALVKSEQWEIGLSKTGYTHEAGNCLALQAQIAGRSTIIVLLDSWGKSSRIGDANRVRKWVENARVAGQITG